MGAQQGEKRIPAYFDLFLSQGRGDEVVELAGAQAWKQATLFEHPFKGSSCFFLCPQAVSLSLVVGLAAVAQGLAEKSRVLL